MPEPQVAPGADSDKWMPSVARPVPAPDPTTEPFWDACRRGELSVQRCRSCKKSVFYPRAICPHCGSSDLDWEVCEGTGVIYSYTVVWRPAHPGMAQAVPYIVALVDLDEGVRLMTNIVGCNPEEVRIGMKVEVVFEKLTEEISIPLFRPVS